MTFSFKTAHGRLSILPVMIKPFACAMFALTLVVPASAAAQNHFVSGNVGWATGGDTLETKPLIGASLMLMGGYVGTEFDITLVPGFYDQGTDTAGAKGNLVLLNGGLVVRIPAGDAPVTPYLAIGGGLARSSQHATAGGTDGQSVSSSDLDLAFGGGAIYHVNKKLGIRGDLRLIRIFDLHSLADQTDAEQISIDHINLWRVSVGATLQF
jgi:hypothetical protein